MDNIFFINTHTVAKVLSLNKLLCMRVTNTGKRTWQQMIQKCKAK